MNYGLKPAVYNSADLNHSSTFCSTTFRASSSLLAFVVRITKRNTLKEKPFSYCEAMFFVFIEQTASSCCVYFWITFYRESCLFVPVYSLSGKYQHAPDLLWHIIELKLQNNWATWLVGKPQNHFVSNFTQGNHQVSNYSKALSFPHKQCTDTIIIQYQMQTSQSVLKYALYNKMIYITGMVRKKFRKAQYQCHT